MPTRTRTGLRFGRAGARGFTLLEILIGSTILLLLAAALVQALSSAKSLAIEGDLEARLQREGDAALARIRRELHLSGFVDLSGKSYPHTFVDGVAGAGFGAHDHALVPEATRESAPANAPSAIGPNREIVFVQPEFTSVQQSSDGTNHPRGTVPVGQAIVRTYDVPEVDLAGDLTWGAPELSFVVSIGGDGRKVLERRVDGGDPRVVARFVERVEFETAAQDPAAIPLNAVRARLWLADRDSRGGIHGRFFEALVELRNTP